MFFTKTIFTLFLCHQRCRGKHESIGALPKEILEVVAEFTLHVTPEEYDIITENLHDSPYGTCEIFYFQYKWIAAWKEKLYSHKARKNYIIKNEYGESLSKLIPKIQQLTFVLRVTPPRIYKKMMVHYIAVLKWAIQLLQKPTI